MKWTTNNIIALFGVMILCMLALIPISVFAMPMLQQDRAENEPDALATIQAMVTQTTVAMTQNAPTQTPLPATATPVPATNTPVPTATALPPTAAPVTYCDWMAFVTDVTIPDGTTFQPGETFTKIWRVKNRGTCTWTPDYTLVFNGGDQMGGTTSVRVPGYIAPGQSVDVSVTLTAPSNPGSYKGYWILRNASGALFGTGDKANTSIYVDIRVKQADPLPHGTITGSLCYPSEFNPPMTLYVENVKTGERIQFAIVENQLYYNVLVPTGRYYVYAWAPGYSLEGAYADPNTNLMIPVTVNGGGTTNMINLCNWSPYNHGRGQ